MANLTAHCIVKNEEIFVGFALRSVIDFVDSIIVFDTGSTDQTVSCVEALAAEFPGKIIIEQKGPADFARHTQLRQEMVERTKTKWFMVLDGDEIWTKRALSEAVAAMSTNTSAECLIAPFYLCVGDIYHYSKRGAYSIRGSHMHATPRFFALQPGLHWSGLYNQDAVVDVQGTRVFEKPSAALLTNKFWHVSHLLRSRPGPQVYSSGGTRDEKVSASYWLVGTPIAEAVPEVFTIFPSNATKPLSFGRSFIQFWPWVIKRILLKLK